MTGPQLIRVIKWEGVVCSGNGEKGVWELVITEESVAHKFYEINTQCTVLTRNDCSQRAAGYLPTLRTPRPCERDVHNESA